MRTTFVAGCVLAGGMALSCSDGAPRTSCFAGCLCATTLEACMAGGCSPAHEVLPDGGIGRFFCSNAPLANQDGPTAQDKLDPALIAHADAAAGE
ncbi:MAG TPA: hypothetical protein VGY54_09555 [Polyangiaceae bacterium]|jgi:hypothetical protein|nr:hypothetical protein [Polyangiaceae bacterium]